jgi:glycosyltransferase involved in cell wall biosynthesis
MKILWFSWKDKKHPLAGGAEFISGTLLKKLAADGHEVILFTSHYTGAAAEEVLDGYRIVRRGSRYTVYAHAYAYYREKLQGWPDIIIDEANTIPFFCSLYAKEKVFIFVHQLARRVWFYEMSFPLNIVGYVLEPLYLRLLRNTPCITVSASSLNSLKAMGFNSYQLHRIPNCINSSYQLLEKQPVKNEATIIFAGGARPAKRPDHAIKVLEYIRDHIPSASLIIIGSGTSSQIRRLKHRIRRSPHSGAIYYRGYVSDEERDHLFSSASVLCVTSVKEGWGLVVTEANRHGTIAAVYDVDGLRDSVKNDITGIVAYRQDPRLLGKMIVELLEDKVRLRAMSNRASEDSLQYTEESCYASFKSVLKI